ncbi:unnamed protein product, partial [Brassica oleracea var. botrytis]
MEWLGGGSWIRARKREFENNAATPIRSTQESPSNTLVLESNEDNTVNDDATEITSSRESHNNTSVLEVTETEKQKHETVRRLELPLPHESDDMLDDVATPIIDPQEIPRGKIKGQTQEEEEHQVEDDADVDDGAKGNENSETKEDEEVNEDASKKPVKVTKKRGRGNKGNKKSVKPPREVQQQVEDDAEVGDKESENSETNEDGEGNEDASKNIVKVTKKRGRGNKVNISVQKKQSEKDSAGDVIERVLEDLKK